MHTGWIKKTQPALKKHNKQNFFENMQNTQLLVIVKVHSFTE